MLPSLTVQLCLSIVTEQMVSLLKAFLFPYFLLFDYYVCKYVFLIFICAPHIGRMRVRVVFVYWLIRFIFWATRFSLGRLPSADRFPLAATSTQGAQMNSCRIYAIFPEFIHPHDGLDPALASAAFSTL